MKQQKIGRQITALTCAVLAACVFSLPAAADDGTDSGVSLCTDSDGLRMLIDKDGFMPGLGDDVFAEAEKTYPAGELVELETIPASGVTGISIDAAFVGVALEPSESGSFELALEGVQNPSGIVVKAEVSGGVLTLTAAASPDIRYICAEEGERVNTVLLRVPQSTYQSVQVRLDTAIACLPELGAPVNGEAGRGILQVRDDAVTSNCTLRAESGSVSVVGGTVSGKIDLESLNGSVRVAGDRVDGILDLRTRNGSARVEASTLGEASLTAQNGSVKVDAGLLSGDVNAETHNGNVSVNLRQKPANLKLDFHCASNGVGSLPDGWTGADRFGSGSPLLKISCQNGRAELQIGS